LEKGTVDMTGQDPLGLFDHALVEQKEADLCLGRTQSGERAKHVLDLLDDDLAVTDLGLEHDDLVPGTGFQPLDDTAVLQFRLLLYLQCRQADALEILLELTDLAENKVLLRDDLLMKLLLDAIKSSFVVSLHLLHLVQAVVVRPLHHAELAAELLARLTVEAELQKLRFLHFEQLELGHLLQKLEVDAAEQQPDEYRARNKQLLFFGLLCLILQL